MYINWSSLFAVYIVVITAMLQR